MIKILFILFLTTITNLFAGLPPTTLSGRSQTSKTTFNFKVPNSQMTSLGGVNALIETGNDNLLINANFEDTTLTGWTCTTGTCVSTTTSGEFSEGVAAYKITSGSPTAISASQSVTVVTGSTTQYVLGLSYKVDTTMTDFQVCTLVAGSEKTCVPSANLIIDNAYHTIEIPEVATPGSTLGIKVKTTATYSAKSVFIDRAYIKQGMGTQSLALDNVYSAHVSSAGTVTLENKDWVSGNCALASSVFTCTFNSGIFTATPSCSATIKDASIGFSNVYTTSSTSAVVTTLSTAGALADRGFVLICQKSGNDYLASSAAVYSQSSANYSPVTFTPTSPNASLAFSADSCTHERDGGEMIIRCKAISTAGASSGLEAQMAIPNSLTTVSTIGSPITLGPVTIGANTATSYYVMAKPSVGYINFSSQSSGTNAQTLLTGSSFADPAAKSFTARIPISGWSNSNVIVGSFAGTPKIPGESGNVDTFSFSYGTTNATTVCSASPCSYLDQIGTALTSVTRSGTGSYTLNFSKTYSKAKCWFTGTVNMSSGSFSCSSCSTLALTTAADSFGNVMCQGTY